MAKKDWKTYAKALVATASPVVVAVISASTDGINGEEWAYIATTVLAALGVYTVPNKRVDEVVVHDNVQ